MSAGTAGPNPRRFGSGRIIALITLVVIALIAVVLITGGINKKDEPSANPAGTPAAKVAEAAQPGVKKAATVADVKAKFADMSYADFRALATPAKRYVEKGRFIDSALTGKSEAQKLDIILTAGAKQRLALVGIIQTTTDGQYPTKELSQLLRSEHAGQTHYGVWDDLRDILTDEDTQVKNELFTGRSINTGLASNGVVTGTPTTLKDEPAVQVSTEAQMVEVDGKGVLITAQKGMYLDRCFNRQSKDLPDYAVPTRTPGKITTTTTTPQGQKPSLAQTEREKGLDFIHAPKATRDDDVRKHGAPGNPIRQATGKERRDNDKRGDDRNVGDFAKPKPNGGRPPATAPAGTGGEIQQGAPAPQQDSSGGTVQQPTAPPTTKPDSDVPSQGSGGSGGSGSGSGGSSEPPAPEDGAPPA